MIRKALLVAAATIAMVTAALSAPPVAAAGPPTITGGSLIRFSDGSSCSVSFVDPVHPRVIYTAAHCYDGSTAVMAGRYRIGHFRPDWVYNKKLDLVAIQLYSDVPSVATQCRTEGCYRFGEPRMPKIGDYVCKWGAKTQETCGTVLNVWEHDFAIQMPVKHGDSGAPMLSWTARAVDITTSGTHASSICPAWRPPRRHASASATMESVSMAGCPRTPAAAKAWSTMGPVAASPAKP